MVDIAAGGAHSACVTSAGDLYTWGKGRYGRLGHSDSEDQLKPKLVRRRWGRGRGFRCLRVGGSRPRRVQAGFIVGGRETALVCIPWPCEQGSARHVCLFVLVSVTQHLRRRRVFWKARVVEQCGGAAPCGEGDTRLLS